MVKRLALLILSFGLLVSYQACGVSFSFGVGGGRGYGRGYRRGWHGRGYRRGGPRVGFGVYSEPRYYSDNHDHDHDDEVRKKIAVTENKDGSTTRCVTKNNVEKCKTTRPEK